MNLFKISKERYSGTTELRSMEFMGGWMFLKEKENIEIKCKL